MVDFEKPLTIPGAIERAARRFPTHTAYLEYDGARRHSITWGELQRRVDETAAGLIALGLGRGERAAICAENSIDWAVAFLAVSAAGATGVPVYFELKAGEICEQVKRPSCRFLLASAGVLAKIDVTATGVQTIIVIGGAEGRQLPTACLPLERVELAATEESRQTLRGRVPAPDDLAAIFYTSGTTGGAKGVMLSHRNFLSNALGVLEALRFNERDSVLLVLPLHHAMPFIAALVILPLVGARAVIENDLRRIRDRLREQKPTIFFGVPALYEVVYRNILARAESEGRLPTLLAWQKRVRLIKRLTGINLGPLIFRTVHQALGGKLRFMVSGGAALSPQTALDYASLGLPLLQGWGMTEASPVVAVQRFSAGRFRYTRYYEQHAGSVGAALPGVEVRLIDVPDKDIHVAVHGEGEVIVRGDNVFRGYWQAEEATAEAMLDGWLRTGDLGRIDKEGNIYLTGRSKYIIVLDSGEKVHPDELEANLATSDLIEDVCIIGRHVRDKTAVTAVIYPRLEAVEAAAAGSGLDGATVEALLRDEVDRLGRQLAAYKRVSRIELTDEPLPKTALRKVARGQIRDGYSFDFERWRAVAAETAAAATR